MPQDQLQIALEHHRAGRLRQAEARYRAMLADDADNADAAHWLGVLMVQAGRADEAVGLLEKAARARPGDPAYWHNLGQAYLACGRGAEGIAAFDRAVEIGPDRPQPLYSAATARLARNAPGDAQSAIALFNRARAAGIDSAELHQHLGIAMLAAGRFDEAIASLQASLDKDALPSRILGAEKNRAAAQTYHQLGVAHRLKGEIEEARRCMSKSLELQPDSARACAALAVMEAEAGRLAEAEALFRRAIGLAPGASGAREGLAMVRAEMERTGTAIDAGSLIDASAAIESATAKTVPPASEAIAELERKLTPSPNAAALHYRLALEANLATPAQAPAEALSGLFDRYAERFDEHLQGKLEYRVPQMIARAIALTRPRKLLDTLDLGCGTGLCGPLLRPMAGLLAGVDISPAMIEKARLRDVYDRLDAGDLIVTLREAGRSFDLLVAADVLIYWGDLAPIFEAAAASLRDGGMFAFSVEAGPGDRFQFNKQTHRFTHSRAYLDHLAAIFGFTQESLAEITVRTESERPVPGYLVVLRIVRSGD